MMKAKNIVAISIHGVVLTAIIVTMGVLGIVATGNDSPIDDKFTGELEKNITLHILENDTAKQEGYLKHLLDAFNEKYKDYGIVAVDANLDQFSDLEQDGPHGYGPDVLYQANDALMKYVDGKHIQPLPVDKLQCYEHIDEIAWDAYQATVGLKEYTFGVPVNVQGPLLYYRKDLLPTNWRQNWDKDHNNIPDMTENWIDMYEYSKIVKEESGGKKYGYMKSLFDTYFSSGYLFTYGAYVFGNNGRDVNDVGFSKGESYKGARIIRQLASVMNEECIDDTITKNAYSKLGNGTYFATMTTPDVYSLFIKELTLEYESKGKTKEEAKALAEENLIVTDIPKLPKEGTLETDSRDFIPTKMMGGINGYAMSSYTKYPNACLAFIDFATSYEMIHKRNEMLAICPARNDVAKDVGGLAEIINTNLVEGNISIMPSVRALSQVWTPAQTFFSDVAKDPFRKKDPKYLTDESLIEGLKKVDKQIYDAIHTLG